jgi:hypothetical protein
MFTRHIIIIAALGLLACSPYRGTAQFLPASTSIESSSSLPYEPGSSDAGYSKDALPSDMTIELLGRCGLYSLSFQQTFFRHLGIEIGGALYGGIVANLAMLSIGGRLYLAPGNASPCIGGGIVYATASIDLGPLSGSGTGSYGYIAPGFEYRSSGGFLFRGSLNVLFNDGFIVWPGIQFGIAF